jgi:biotin transporter BioY
MNEETLGMIVGFLIVAPITGYVVYKILKKRVRGKKDGNHR